MWVRDKLRSFFDALIRGEERAASIYFWTMMSGAAGIAAFAAIGYVLYGPR